MDALKCKYLLFLILAAGMTAVSACHRQAPAKAGEYNDPHPLPAEPRTTRVASPGRYGGRFVLAQTQSPKTFNAMMENEQSSSDVTNLLFSSLTNYDNITQETTAELAKSWEVARDGVTWTYHLRKGAAFSDGHPMTAEDVLFSFQLVYDQALHPSTQDLVKMEGKPFELSAPDPYTVVFKTPAPNPLFLAVTGAVRIMPKHVLEPAYKNGSFASSYNVSTPPEKLVSSGAW